MPDETLFMFGVFVFGLLGIGVGLTISEFRWMAIEIDRKNAAKEAVPVESGVETRGSA